MFSCNPPIFVIGSSDELDSAKDTLLDLSPAGEACLSIVSEHCLKAADASSKNAPYGTSEWALSRLTPVPGF